MKQQDTALIEITLPRTMETWVVKYLWRYLLKTYKQCSITIHREKHRHQIRMEEYAEPDLLVDPQKTGIMDEHE